MWVGVKFAHFSCGDFLEVCTVPASGAFLKANLSRLLHTTPFLTNNVSFDLLFNHSIMCFDELLLSQTGIPECS